jgi:hypothetical protein
MQLRTEAFVKWQSKQPVAKRAGLISALDHIKRSGRALASGNCLSVGHLLMGDAIEKPDRGGVLRIECAAPAAKRFAQHADRQVLRRLQLLGKHRKSGLAASVGQRVPEREAILPPRSLPCVVI